MNKMNAENKVPAIRFKGFIGQWEEKALGEYAKFRRGSFPQPYGNKEWYDGEGAMPFVQVVDVTKKLTLVKDTKQKISIHAQPKSVFVEKGKVLVTLQGSIGRVAIAQYNTYVDRTLLIFERFESKTNSHYWAYLIQNKFDFEKKRAPGGTIKTITKEALSDFLVNIPVYEEQVRIGNYFQQLDIHISQHQQKQDKLLSIKKALLEKMLPKQGETVPEIRFKGFSGDWEETNLEKITDLLTGNPFDSKGFSKRGIFLVRGMNVKRGYLDMSEDIAEYWPKSLGLEKFLLKTDDILIQMDGALIGKSYAKVNTKNTPALLVQRVTRIRSWRVDPDFTYQYIQKDFLKHISKIKTETAVPHLSLNDIRDFRISVPKTEEQTKIGSMFKQLDALIKNHQTQLKKLENIKQACLEKMFI